MFGFTPPQVSATLQFITLTGAGIWVIFFFWPALRKQLAFMVISLEKMEASEARMGEMVTAMKTVATDIKTVAEVKTDVNWEKTRKMVEEVYSKINFAIAWATPERKKAGQQNIKRALHLFARGAGLAEKHLNGAGKG